jgi:hypothetical protein
MRPRLPALLLALVIVAVGVVAAQAAPSAADVTNARGRAVDDTEEATTGASITTTTVNVMAAIADATFSVDVVQNFRIVNSHATQKLCLKTVDRAASTTSCTTVCGAVGAGALTCTGSGAADGILLTAGSPPFTYAVMGTECFCAEAEAAATTYNVSRVARAPNQ